MNEGDFWRLVDQAGQQGSAAFLANLRLQLAGQPVEGVRGFHVVLDDLVCRLRTDQFRAAVAATDQSVEGGAGSDHLDHVAAAALASGSAVYQRIVTDAQELSAREWDADLGDDLLALPGELLRAIPDHPMRDEQVVPGNRGLALFVTAETYPPDMPAWRRTLGKYSEWFDLETEREAWAAWLRPSGPCRVEMWFEVEGWDDGVAGLELRSGQHVREMNLIRVKEAQLSSAQQVSAAEADLGYVIEQLESRLKLGAPPGWPPAEHLKAELRRRRRTQPGPSVR